jgi:hypothetical protein
MHSSVTELYQFQVFPVGKVQKYAGSEILTVVVMNAAIVWDIASCSPVRHDVSEELPHVQDRKSSQ